MRIDTTDAMTTFETLGAAVKAAGIGKYNGFLLVEELRSKGFRLVLEQMPIEVEVPIPTSIRANECLEAV